MSKGLFFLIAIVLLIFGIATLLNQRYEFVEGVRLAPPSPPQKGSSSGVIVPAQDCCLCVYDENALSSEALCRSWLRNQKNCAVKKLTSIDTDDSQCWENAECGHAFSPDECVGKELRMMYYGHSGSSQCTPFIDKVFEVCVNSGASCANVVNEGCRTFNDYLDALTYITQMSEKTGVTANITANQCLVAWNPILQRCLTNTESKCTISVDATCSRANFAPCNFGYSCTPYGLGYSCDSAYCFDEATQSVVKKVCCPEYPLFKIWRREEECSTCTPGACCIQKWDINGNDGGIVRQSSYCADRDLNNIFYNENTCVNESSGGLFGQFTESTFFSGKTCGEVECPADISGSCCLELTNSTTQCSITTYDSCIFKNESNILHRSWWPQGSCTTTCQTMNNKVGACCMEGGDNNSSTCISNLTREDCAGRFYRKDHSFTQVSWTEGKTCEEVSCGPSGRCCIEYDDGTKECKDSLSYSACQAILNQSVGDKDVVGVRWNQAILCSAGGCSEFTGACCIQDKRTPADPTCRGDMTFQACKAIELNDPTYMKTSWNFDKKCGEFNCAASVCPVGYVPCPDDMGRCCAIR